LKKFVAVGHFDPKLAILQMSVSKIGFDRWISREQVSWAFQVFNKYSQELSHMYITHVTSQEYVYRNLGKNAKWEDPVTNHFQFADPIHKITFKDLKHWSDSFNDFDNWINLNSIMAISSNLETYFSKIVQLALESDTGTLYGVSRRIDGVEILKHSTLNAFNFEDKIIACTKGEWGSRINSFVKLFGTAPPILIDNISGLDKLRKLRNEVGHAFGREIEETRRHDVLKVSKSAKLTRERTIYYMKLIYGISREVDKQLLINHIGEYQTVFFYHHLTKILSTGDSNQKRQLGNHVAVLKRKLGRFGALSAGKQFCRELIEYYESL
jgi:hypothetical protein